MFFPQQVMSFFTGTARHGAQAFPFNRLSGRQKAKGSSQNRNFVQGLPKTFVLFTLSEQLELVIGTQNTAGHRTHVDRQILSAWVLSLQHCL
ncbi:MAG: hypothetical protein ACD_62C00324G0002 [uncultured bacterium]|nr:MAG: hypothetical protein ACD_62C00324G0002 [uncultured bacterium]